MAKNSYLIKKLDLQVDRASLASYSSNVTNGQLNHGMPNIKGVKHKVDTKGTDLTKLPPSPVKVVHRGLPYSQVKIKPRVDSWRYFDTMVNKHITLSYIN